MSYLVVETFDSCESANDRGAYIHGEYATLEAAKAKLHSEAEGWSESACVPDGWKPGYCSDEPVRWSKDYWDEDDLVAWRDMHALESWVKIQIFSRDDDGVWHVVTTGD